MKIGTYINRPWFDKQPVISISDFYNARNPMRKKLKDGLEILGEREYSELVRGNVWEINFENSFISDGENIKFPIAYGRNGETTKGEFIAAEKWINPYWKRNSTGKLYLPGDTNPIGKYLIVLADPWKEEKIKTSIHAWPGKPVNIFDFQQGTPTKGCISLKKKDMKILFSKMQPGDIIQI